MEYLRVLLSNAAKLTMLELRLPELKDQHKELKETLSDRKLERDWAIIHEKNLEDPTFFQRIFTRVDEKLDKARTEAREATAAYETTKREWDAVEHQLQTTEEEISLLSGSWEVYKEARLAFLSTADEAAIQLLGNLEIEAFRPIAIECVRKIRKALYAARGWMQKDLRPRYGTVTGRRMEFLHLADDYAEKLQTLLIYFPEGSVTLGASVSEPSSYVHSVSTNLSQIDLLNIAVEQSQRVQAQLEAL